METHAELTQRVAVLEAEVAQLKRKLATLEATTPWWEQIAGTFAHDPLYAKAMQLGRAYRQSLRPKPTSRRRK